MDLQTSTGIIVNLTIILSVPLTVYRYFRTTQRDHQDREYDTYNAPNEKYLEFLKLCLERPYLDVYDYPDYLIEGYQPVVPTAQQKKEELIAFNLLIGIFEHAFLTYHDQSSKIRQQQWEGWEEYIRNYCARENFRAVANTLIAQFDESFHKYMKKVIDEVDKELIHRGGVKLSPFDIEDVILQFPGVKFALAVAFENEYCGQEVGAYVIAENGITPDALITYCRQRLTFEIAPKVIIFGADIPVTSNGKSPRLNLRDRFRAWEHIQFSK